MSFVKIIKPGFYTSIQDDGRFGYAMYGIPKSGYMDSDSADKANFLVGNDTGTSLLECTIMPPRIEFQKNFIISLTGADMRWQVDKYPVPRYTSLYVRKGSVLSGNSSIYGFRSYIALQGGINIKEVLSSQSALPHVDSLPSSHFARLVKDQLIPIKRVKANWQFKYIADEERLQLNAELIIPIKRGPEWHLLDQASKEKLISNKWKISADSDRMGARLTNHTVSLLQSGSKQSVPIFPGIIQAPNDGEPIVVLNDGHTIGGYPRIAIIPSQSLGRFCQIRPGESFSFYLVL